MLSAASTMHGQHAVLLRRCLSCARCWKLLSHPRLPREVLRCYLAHKGSVPEIHMYSADVHRHMHCLSRSCLLLPLTRPCCKQENANKPEGLAPNQGGKYVGFGSDPGPAPKGRGGEDLSAQLAKGFSQLSTVAGVCSLDPGSRGMSAAWGGNELSHCT